MQRLYTVVTSAGEHLEGARKLSRREVQETAEEIVRSVYSVHAIERAGDGYYNWQSRLTFGEFSQWVRDNPEVLVHLLRLFRSHFHVQRETEITTNIDIQLSSSKESESVLIYHKELLESITRSQEAEIMFKRNVST
eukprot:TRINITY_DN5293_c0_g1_i1.p1 TRINITY_DN5293_c0_g1~~TRINITY_DN5293_c0_g1_i1.p1  ORF type:complete len:137 (+),score=16.34 TRINITY_DN5293_c0_g1_i1:660-1070(+)